MKNIHSYLFVLIVISLAALFIDFEISKTKYSFHTINSESGAMVVFRFNGITGRIDQIIFKRDLTGVVVQTNYPIKDVFDGLKSEEFLDKK